MLMLSCKRPGVIHEEFRVIGDANGIRTLYWLLMSHKSIIDSAEHKIREVTVANLEGYKLTHDEILRETHSYSIQLSENEL